VTEVKHEHRTSFPEADLQHFEKNIQGQIKALQEEMNQKFNSMAKSRDANLTPSGSKNVKHREDQQSGSIKVSKQKSYLQIEPSLLRQSQEAER
jgi:hypothetical protein